MKLYSIGYIPGKEITALGLVSGATVQAVHLGMDFIAGLKNLVGGEIVDYTRMISDARRVALDRMIYEADTLGADAVVGVHFGTSSVMQSAAEVVAYGTAVKIRQDA